MRLSGLEGGEDEVEPQQELLAPTENLNEPEDGRSIGPSVENVRDGETYGNSPTVEAALTGSMKRVTIIKAHAGQVASGSHLRD